LKPKKVLEIGTWCGVRAQEMMGQTDGEYYGFDLFEDATEDSDKKELNVKRHYNVSDVLSALSSCGIKGKLFKGNTRETLPEFREKYPDVKFDFAFIDGGHSLETIRSDWSHVREMMNDGGVVVFDDFYVPENPGFGCNEVIEELDAEILPDTDNVVGGGQVRMVRVNV
jgi:predicted O-methyltransferase YrrM